MMSTAMEMDLGMEDGFGQLFPESQDLLSDLLDLQQVQQDDDQQVAGVQQQEQVQKDLLQSVIDEIKMAPMDIKVEEDNNQAVHSTSSTALLDLTATSTTDDSTEMKSLLADYDDLLFEEPPQLQEGDHEHQGLIQEMEEFLSQHEQGTSSSVVEDVSMASATTNVSMTSSASDSLTAAEAEQAEQIVEALVSGDLTLDSTTSYTPEQQMQLARDTGLVSSNSNASAIGATISNISEIVTEDGNRIVIVIANDGGGNVGDVIRSVSPMSYTANQVVPSPSSVSYAASSPAGSSVNDFAQADDGDSDWTPDSPVANITKKRSSPNKKGASSVGVSPSGGGVSKRGKSSSPKQRYNVKDKKERKKLQNVVAARRYRDKKKGEQAELEEEEQGLEERNKELRDALGEMENEVKTLKKLMVELGLVKVSGATARALKK